MNVRIPVLILLLLVQIAIAAWGTAPAQYKAETGQFETGTASGVRVYIPERNRNLLLNVSYPKGTGPFPLIVFFHGALCSADGYADLADYWASHGYVVILPSHPDIGRSTRRDQEQQLKAFLEQVADMSSILDSIDDITTQIEPLSDKVDLSRAVAAGHSMGALIATVAGGLPRLMADGGHLSLKDDRFDALVLLSGPGPLPRTPQNGWESVTLPTLVTTGTRDHANRGGEGATWEWRLGAFRLTPPGNKYGLVIDEADHFLGGMICAERAAGPPDHEAFAIVRSVSTAFLDAYLKNSRSALDFLQGATIAKETNGRAELLSR